MPEPILRNSPLSNVVCEVRFDVRPPDASSILRLSEQLESSGLTDYRTEEGIQLTVGPGAVQQVGVKRHRFAAADGSMALTLDLGAFAFETAAYAGIDAFLTTWEPVAQAVSDALELQSRTRLGLRYVNEVQLTDDAQAVVASAINADLLPPWGAQEHLQELSNSLHELRFGQAEGELTFRHGMQRPGAGAPPVYLLDFDHYEQRLRALDVEGDALRLRHFNATVNDVFRWSITAEQYQLFEPKERPDA